MAGESHPPPFHGQSRQQRHPEDELVNGLPGSSSGAFLLPADTQGFSFSAEPGPIDYASMTSLTPSSGTAQDLVFTPNTNPDSSYDSSLHPDYITTSYPPPNYMGYSLSPGIQSRNGQSISPSHSTDHLSTDAGYLSDPNYQDPSNYTSPSFNGQYTNDFAQLNFVNPSIPANTYEPFPEMSLPMTSNVLATYNAQAHPPLPSSLHSDHAQLVSPCLTNDSSPYNTYQAPTQANLSQSNLSGMQYARQEHQHSSSPPVAVPHTMYSTPRKQQHSPALTNSSGGGTIANPQPLPAHLTSPIVRVENYSSRGASPSISDASRPVSKRSHGSRRSGNHLSPFPMDQDDSSEDEDARPAQPRLQSVVQSTERADDGSWLPSTGTGQTGLSPDEREAIGDIYGPSIEELANLKLKEDKKLEVQDWLTKSEAASEAGDGDSSSRLLKPFVHRRRAKSTNDVHRQGYGGLGVCTDFDRMDDSGIPGPGVYVDERSEYDEYEDDDEDDEDMEPESPPAEIDLHARNADYSYFPPVDEPYSLLEGRPWVDVPTQSFSYSNSTTRYQPETANAAMMHFRSRAKDVETASLAATLGSRRLSESDLGSIRQAPGIIKAIKATEPATDLKKHKERQRRPSFLENILPKRAPSNILKRKGSILAQQSADEKAKALDGIEKPKRIGSWGRPKSPRLDTSFAYHGKEFGSPNAANLSATNGPWYQGAKNAIRRTRSRSDLGRSPGLAELMTQHGGPPMPMLASPLADTEATKPSPQPSLGLDDDDDEAAEPVTMDLKIRDVPIIPTYEGFKTHARTLNPRLVDYMVERITQEQMRRYKRLLEFRVKHLNAVKNQNCASRTCASGNLCPDLNGSSKQLPPRAGNKDLDAPFIGFQITAPGSSDDDGEPPPEGTVVSAQFPSGVPLPPVKRLPAEFECQLCFKVKQFYKPSDWTKHVHEDVQPFTCTFPNCGEPKSFKRKADWVRHENERHRQLENWTCNIPDCNHTCYRKDNFVQHLVREHKIAEPRPRTGRNKDVPSGADADDIWSRVEQCRQDTDKQPKDEPCRFCGNICNSWKKLTVHLAKHMEQISIPILALVEQKQINVDTVISPVIESLESRKLCKSPVDNPSRYNPNAKSTLAPGISPSFGHFPHDLSTSGAASNTMHTYPPPQLMNYKNQLQSSKGGFTDYGVDNIPAYSGQGQTYPGLQEPPKAQSYLNARQLPSQPYVNGNMQNGPTQYRTTPISTMGQQRPTLFTSSPVDTTPYSNNALSSTYFTHERQTTTSVNGAMPDMGFNGGNNMQYNASAYQLPYVNGPQNNYPYQG